jgi:ABC-type multidrug transport system fused ATPase/permease subunit
MEKNYSNLHRKLVLKYFWQAAKRYKKSLLVVVFSMLTASILDVYIPLQYLKLWKVLSSNDFTIISVAKSVIILILLLNLTRFIVRRFSGFSLSFFEASSMAALREQAFSYMLGHSHSFFANNFGGSLTQKINKYARAFEKLTDRMMVPGL